MPARIKDKDPFLGMRKKVGLMVNLEATRQTATATSDSEEEAQP